MHDAIVIGAGPNGLTAAVHLARAGLSVLVLEANQEPGGACRTGELTLPGFKHDLGAAFFPFAPVCPAFAPLDLGARGVEFRYAPIDTAHPAPDGTCASISRDLPLSVRCFGADGEAFRALAMWHARIKDRLIAALLAPLPAAKPLLRLGLENLLRLARVAMSSPRGLSCSRFRTEAAQRVIPGLALHGDIGPDDSFGAMVGFVLAMLASSVGFGVPQGGASSIPLALTRCLEEASGTLRCGARVTSIVVASRRAVAVRLESGEEIEAARAIVADVAAPTLYLRLLDPEVVPPRVIRAMRHFTHGFATFKMDWALDGEVPWSHPDAARAAVVHAGDSLTDLARYTREVRAGKLPENPYLVVGQQSLADPTRAPPGRHTLWAYSHVPTGIEGGWARAKEAFADRIEARIEGLAPGFQKRILARVIFTPSDLEAVSENLIDGDLSGGSMGIRHQLFARPVFPYFRYRTPVEGLYLGSSYAHPGGGVHGAPGANAAQAVLDDIR